MNTIETMKYMLELTKAGWTKDEILAVVASKPVQVAHAEAVDTIPAKQEPVAQLPAKQEQSFRVSAADILAESKNTPTKAHEPSEFNFWRAVNRDGESRTWCGWANPNNGEPNFPGHKLYRINDFYIKKLGGKHSCYSVNGELKYSAKYDMRNGRQVMLANYQVRNVVAKDDREAFIEYMKTASEKARSAMDESWFEQ